MAHGLDAGASPGGGLGAGASAAGGLGASLALAGHHASAAIHGRPSLGGDSAHEEEGHEDEGGGDGHEGQHADSDGPGAAAGPGNEEESAHDKENGEHEEHAHGAHEDEHAEQEEDDQEEEQEAAPAADGAGGGGHDAVDHQDIEAAHKSAEEAGAGEDAQGGAQEGGAAEQDEQGEASASHDQSHASANDYAQGEAPAGDNPDSLGHHVDESSANQVSEHLPKIVGKLQENFGEDFSNVKFSNDVPAGAKEHGAKAVAGPEHVALDSSVNLGTQEGQATLGEELGHVTQMRRNTVQPDAIDMHGGAGMAAAGTAAGESRERAENEASSAGAAAARGERVNIGSGGAVPQNLFFGLGSLWNKAKSVGSSVVNTAKSAGSWALDKGKQGVSAVVNTASSLGSQAMSAVGKGVSAATSTAGSLLNKAGGLYTSFNEKKNGVWDQMNAIANPLLKFGVKKAAGFIAGKIPGISPLLGESYKDPKEGGKAKFLGALNPLKWYGAIKTGAKQASDLAKGGLLDRMGFRDIGARFKKIERFVGGKVNSLKDWGMGKLKGGLESAKNFGKSAWSSTKKAASSAWNTVKSAPGKLMDKVKGLFPKKGGPPGFFGKLFAGAKDKVGSFFGKAKGLAGDLFGKAKSMGGKALEFMKGMPGKAWDLAKTLPGKAFEGVKGLGGMIKNLLPKGGGSPGFFGKAMAGLKKLGGGVMSTLGKLGGKAMPFISKMGGTLAKLGKSAMPILSGLGKTLKTMGPGALKVLAPVGKFLGKAGAKIIPGLNIAASVISAGLSGKAAYDNFAKGNITGGLIDSFNTVTNAIGVVPVIGGVVSIAGDLISGGLHWLTGS